MTSPTSRNGEFIYLLNAFEQASQADDPSVLDYARKRKALLDYVAKLEAAQSETGDRQKLLAKACDAAFAFIDSHVADPDLTDEMIVKHAAYIEARRALEGTP